MAKTLNFVHPTTTFPYKIRRRLDLLSVPRKTFYDSMEGMPEFTNWGTRKSALKSVPTDRVNEMSWPWVRRLMIIKKMYKNRFSPERLELIERMIEASNATLYSKLANCDVRKQDTKDTKKKKAWTEKDWKKHADFIASIAAPKKVFKPPPVQRGKSMPLEYLMPRIQTMTSMPKFKCYMRQSQEDWYRDPVKVPPKALQYVITDRIRKLATPRVVQEN